jgi:hypothetical protein
MNGSEGYLRLRATAQGQTHLLHIHAVEAPTHRQRVVLEVRPVPVLPPALAVLRVLRQLPLLGGHHLRGVHELFTFCGGELSAGLDVPQLDSTHGGCNLQNA